MSYRLKLLVGDKDVLELVVEMREFRIVDIYIEHLKSNNQKELPKALLEPIEINDDVDDRNKDTGHKLPTPTLYDFDNNGDDEEGINLYEAVHGEDIRQNNDKTINVDGDEVRNNVDEIIVVGVDECGLRVKEIVVGGGDEV